MDWLCLGEALIFAPISSELIQAGAVYVGQPRRWAMGTQERRERERKPRLKC